MYMYYYVFVSIRKFDGFLANKLNMCLSAFENSTAFSPAEAPHPLR